MSKFQRKALPFMIALMLISCSGHVTPTLTPTIPLPDVSIARHPEPVDYSGYYLELTSIPVFDPSSTDIFQIDLRSRDLTKIDMTESLSDLLYADFDSKTQWPASNKMPIGFNWQKIMEINKDPGLGVRNLHDQEITGKGVGIAIIDQTLLVDHIEYKDRVRVYEEAEDIIGGWRDATMHGAAVASIAIGKTVGVAPDADLYFIATSMCSDGTYESNDYACLARSVRRIIKINESLPVGRNIRVLSISVGWGPESKGYDEIMSALDEAKTAGIFVINVGLDQINGWSFMGLGRDLRSDPNDFQSYKPGSWWQNQYYQQGLSKDTLLIPMDSRTTASPTGLEDYVFYSQGGISWSVPYLAGVYALAVQVSPDITPEAFWETALNTGRTIQIQHNGKDYEFGVILDPQALIESLKSK